MTTNNKNFFVEEEIKIYENLFTDIYPIVSDDISSNRRVKSHKLTIKDVDFSKFDAFSGLLKNNIIFIDIDNKEGEGEGTKQWHTLLVELDLYEEFNVKNPNTLAHITKNSGFHLFFKLPKGVDKSTLPAKLSSNVEIKIREAYLPDSYIEVKGMGGFYKALNKKEVQEIPVSLLVKMTSNSYSKKLNEKKPKKEKSTENLDENDGKVVMGNNEVNWDEITFEDIKVKMNTVTPDIDYDRWLYQMYLFITLYTKLKELGKEPDVSCEDFLVQWSARGKNKGGDDREIIKGIIKNYSYEKNQDKLLPEKNYLITYYEGSTSFESYSKMMYKVISKLKKAEDVEIKKIRGWVLNQLNDLSKAFIEDIMRHRECFMISKDNKTNVYTLEAFTINNRWEKIYSNSVHKKTKEPLYLNVIYSILASDNRTLYSNNLLQYMEMIFFSDDILNNFVNSLSVKITTSLYGVDLSPKPIPNDCDIFGFKNLALKLTKNPADIKVISWEQVRSYRLREEIYMSTTSVSSKYYEQFIGGGIMFDPSVLRYNLTELEDKLLPLFTPLFWDFSLIIINNSNKDEVIEQARIRMRLFFGCMGKAMLRYKKNVAQMLFLLSGYEKQKFSNGGNGKSFLSNLITTIFGRTKIGSRGLSNSSQNKDKYTEGTLEGMYLQILDDMPDSDKSNTVNIKHLVKNVGERQSEVRPMNQVSYEETMIYDTMAVANNFDRRMSSDEGNLRRIVYLELQNAAGRCPIGRFDTIEQLIESHKDFYREGDQTEDVGELSDYYSNMFLNEAYKDFFEHELVKKVIGKVNIVSNIFFTYLAFLGEIFATSKPEFLTSEQINIKSLLFTYCIRQGNEVLKVGDVKNLPGNTPFEVRDYSTPIFNLLKSNIIFNTSADDIGLLTTRKNLFNIIDKILITSTDKHVEEIKSFIMKAPSIFIDNGVKPLEFINIRIMDLGGIFNALNNESSSAKLGSTPAKFNNKLYADLQNLLYIGETESKFKFDSFNVVNESKVAELLSLFNINKESDSYKFYIQKNKHIYDNKWLRLQK